MASEGDPKIRRIAIVLQSMDADTVRKLLAQFPQDVARAIRRAFSNLGTVSPAERAAAAQELQSLLGKPANTKPEHNPAAQVLDQGRRIQDAIQISPEARSASAHLYPVASQVTPEAHLSDPGSRSSGRMWLNVPPSILARILEHERPIVIAAVLHELPVVMATAVLQQLPIPRATETMVAMPNLHRNDPTILDELLDQIAAKAEDAIRSEQKSQIGLEKLKAIVAHAPEDQKFLWATSLGHIDPQLPAELGWSRGASDTQATMSPPPSPQPLTKFPVRETANLTSSAIAPAPETDSKTLADAPEIEFRSLTDLLKLDDSDFVSLLHAIEPDTVLLALAGADRKFQKRVERLMPRKDISRLRQRVNRLSDVSLREIDQAHLAILERANALHSEGRIGRDSNISFSAAA